MTMVQPRILRTLGALEHLFAAYGENGTMNFSIAARISGTISEPAVTAALAQVQDRHVLLRASVGWTPDGAHCFMLTERRIPLRVEAAPIANWARIAESEMNRPLLSSDSPLVRGTIVRGLGSTTLVLTFNHAITDGMGAVLVMREVLTALSGAALPEVPGDARLEDRIGLEVSLFHRHSTLGGETTCKDVGGVSAPASIATVDSIEIDRDRLAKLLCTARSHATTLNSMITAGLGKALVTINDQRPQKPLRVMSPIDLRSGFDIPEHVGLSLSIAITSFERDNTTFWDEVYRVHQQIAKFRERKMAFWMVGDIAKRCIEDPSYDATRRRVLERSPFDSITTNFGVLGIPKRFGDLVVEKIWAPALRSVPGQDAVAAATFDGGLSLVHTSVAGTDGLLVRLVEIMEEA